MRSSLISDFTATSTKEAREAAIRGFETWGLTQSLSRARNNLIQRTLDYAKTLVNPGEITSVTSLFRAGTYSRPDASRYSTVVRILSHAANPNLPDLLFLQAVINELTLISDTNSRLRDQVLPLALTYKEALMLNHIKEMQLIGIAGLLAGLFYRTPFLLLAPLILFPQVIVQLRIDQALKETLLAPILEGARMEPLGDGLDQSLASLAQLSRRVLNYGQNTLTSLLRDNEAAPARLNR